MMLRKWLLKVIQGLDWLDRGIAWTWWIYLGVFLLVTFEVVMRYVFYSSHDWAEEIIVFTCVGVSLLGSGRATLLGRHISLELVYARLKGRRRRVADITNGLIVMGVSGVMSVFVFQWGMFLDRMGMFHTSSLETPLSLVAYALFAGMALNAIYGFGIFLRAALAIPSGKEADEELERAYVKY
ncbi:hypothetical protein ES703_79235 [subsurface metagenome]